MCLDSASRVKIFSVQGLYTILYIAFAILCTCSCALCIKKESQHGHRAIAIQGLYS